MPYLKELHALSEQKKHLFKMLKKNPDNERFYIDKIEAIKKAIENLHKIAKCKL